MKIIEYPSSEGREFFLEVVNSDDVLFALLRLRFPKEAIFPELENSAIVRELHVYGQALNLSEENKEGSGQHIGLGKQLMEKAEELAKQNGYKKIAVISGIGVREYYKKIGYELEGNYMVKGLRK